MNLKNHHVPVFGRCGWCRKGWGTTSHVLIFCEKVQHRWHGFEFLELLKKWEGGDISDIGEAMRREVSRGDFALWLTRMWLIWKGLCGEKHNNIKMPCRELRSEGEEFLVSYAAAREQAALQKRVLPLEGSAEWSRPKRGCFRLDVDYVVDERNGRGGVGAIARNDDSGVVFALAKPVSISNIVLHGELRALMHGIVQCIQDGLTSVEAYSDYLLAIRIIAEEDERRSVLCEEMVGFFEDVKRLNVRSFLHTRREANAAAHELAKFAKTLDFAIVWHDNWPLWLENIVSIDSS